MKPIANIELTKQGLNFIYTRGRNTLDELARMQGRESLIQQGLIRRVSAEDLKLAWDW